MISLASPTERVPRSFAFLAKGRESVIPAPSEFDQVPTKNQMAYAPSLPLPAPP